MTTHTRIQAWFENALNPGQLDFNVIDLIDWEPYLRRGFCLRGSSHWHKIGAPSRRVLRLLSEIVESHTDDSDSNWLLKYRPQFREIIDLGTIPLLALVAQQNPNSGIRCLAIWLMGRCRTTLSSELVARFHYDLAPRNRREVIRALRRLGDTAMLARVAAVESDPELKVYAAEFQQRSHDDRLRQFVRTIEPSVIGQPAPFELSAEVELKPHRPKPRWMIRLLLERIRRLLRGEEGVG